MAGPITLPDQVISAPKSRYVVLPDPMAPADSPEFQLWQAQQKATYANPIPGVTPGVSPTYGGAGQGTGNPTSLHGRSVAEAASEDMTEDEPPGMGALAAAAELKNADRNKTDILGNLKPPVVTAAEGASAEPATQGAAPGAAAAGRPAADPYANFAGRPGGGGGAAPKPPFDELDALDAQRTAALGTASDDAENAKWAHLAGVGNLQKHTEDTIGAIAEMDKMKQHFWETSKADAIQAQAYSEEMARMAAAKTVDPDHYWKSKSTGDRIRMGIALALGEFGAHMPHVSGAGPSAAFQIMQAAINRDVEAQKDNIANMWKAATHGQEIAKDKMAFAKFEQEQFDKRKMTALELLNIQMEGIKATTQSADAVAKLSMIQADIEAQKAQIGQAGFMRRYQYKLGMVAAAGNASAAANKGYAEYLKDLDKDRFELMKANPGMTREEAIGALPTLPRGHWIARGLGVPGAAEAADALGSRGQGPPGGRVGRAAMEKEAEAAAGDKQFVDDLTALPNYNWDANSKYNPWSEKQAKIEIGAINAQTQIKIQDKAKRLAAAGDEEGAKRMTRLMGDDAVTITGNESDQQLAAKKQAILKVTGAGQTPLADRASGKQSGATMPGSAKPAKE